MKCPACDYEASQADFGEQLKCPDCGAFYAKALAAKQRAASIDAKPTDVRSNLTLKTAAPTSAPAQPVIVVDIQMRFWSMVVFMVKWTLAAIPALLILVVLGTVAVSVATSVMLGSVGTVPERPAMNSLPAVPPAAAPSSAEVPAPETPAASKTLIDVKLLRKDFEADKYDRGAITFTLEFTNRSSRDIRAFEGALMFNDLLGNTILTSKLMINDPVSKALPMRWDGKIDYNQFIDRHERLRNERFENLNIQFKLNKVLFQDGESLTF